jgi:hypothetical protein
MKRTIAAAMITIGLVACGGGDDDAGTPDDTTEEPADAGTDEPAAEPADGTDEPAAEPTAEEPAAEPTAEEPADEPAGDSIDSIDDIPEECRDLMADFLRDIEPIVEPVDWSNATLADFEQIAADFEERSAAFDTQSGAEGCDDLDFADDDGFDLVVEFADDVAPGTVPFFEFLDSMRGSVVPPEDDEALPTGGLEDCDDAVDGIEQLMDDYDAFSEVPVSELTKYANMGMVMTSCTPEQLEFLENQDVSDFLSR